MSIYLLDTTLALEKHEAGSRYHAAAEEGVSTRENAEAIGRGLRVPVVSIASQEAPAHFGWLSTFMAWDNRASSAKTREKLGWTPTGPTLLTDLSHMNFFPA